jgi:hypothetical protein
VFEVTVIRPFIHAAHLQAILHTETRLPIEFAPSNPIIADTLQFLNENDYHNSIQHSHLPNANLRTPCPVLPLDGFISRKRPECFIWEKGYFEKSSEVILGNSGRLARVMGICGMGRNYIMMRMIELGCSLRGELWISRMVVSSPPTSAWIALLRLFITRFFKPILRSMSDFIDKEGAEQERVISTSEESFAVSTSSEEIGDAGDLGFADDEGTD